MANHTPAFVKQVQLNGYNLMNGFTDLTIYEDINKSCMTGYIDVMESVFMREELPIIGEEILVVQFASMKYTTPTPDDFFTGVFRVTKMSHLTEGHKATQESGISEEQYTYRLHFQSLMDDVNRVKRIRKAYKGKPTEIASLIMDKMLNGSTFETIDPAKNDVEVVFPNWQPFKCIQYLASLAVSEEYSPDPHYLFYQDRDGYHLTTPSKLFDQDKKHDIKKVLITGQADTQQDQYTIQGMKFLPLFDTWSNEVQGMYGQTFVTYDKINKVWEEQTDTYSGAYGKFNHIGKQKLTKMKVEKPKMRYQFMSVNQEKNPGAYAFTDEYQINNSLRAAQVNGLRSLFWLNRGTSIRIGDIVDIGHKNKTNEPDKVIGGKWMITRMRHQVTQAGYFCQCEAVKDGLG